MIPLFFLVALVYSMAGFGGGSSYLALLVLFGVPFAAIPAIALICNLAVVTNGSFQYIREGHFSGRLLTPFMLTSIPAAWLGGRIHVDKTVFLILLAAALLSAGLHILFSRGPIGRDARLIAARRIWLWGLPAGALLGGLSGLVGIGGGIFLSPVLHSLRWGNSKQIAAASSVFILVNSIAGLAGQLSKPVAWEALAPLLWLPLAACAGGIAGSFLGSRKFSFNLVQRVTAVLILYASLRVWLLL